MDTFKPADEVRAENRGETWDAETEQAVPAVDAPVETQVETPVESTNTVTE